jgi:hypothetical protein
MVLFHKYRGAVAAAPGADKERMPFHVIPHSRRLGAGGPARGRVGRCAAQSSFSVDTPPVRPRGFFYLPVPIVFLAVWVVRLAIIAAGVTSTATPYLL